QNVEIGAGREHPLIMGEVQLRTFDAPPQYNQQRQDEKADQQRHQRSGNDNAAYPAMSEQLVHDTPPHMRFMPAPPAFPRPRPPERRIPSAATGGSCATEQAPFPER